MIIKAGLNNLNCLVTIEKNGSKYFYIDNTKDICKEIKKGDIKNYIN